MGDLIDRDKIYEAVYDLACASAGVIDGICEDYAHGLLEASNMIAEAPAVDAVPMTHDLDSTDLIRRKDVLWITKETGALETQSRVRELPAVDAAPVVHGRWQSNGIHGSVLCRCSECHYDAATYSFCYCPMCGAKMGGEGDAKCQN